MDEDLSAAVNDQEFQSLLERLVDGELSTGHERHVIAMLDVRPNGWRQCAIAFLEAQALRREFSTLVSEPSPKSDADNIATINRNSRVPVARPLSLAVALLLAFTLGIAVRGGWNHTSALKTTEHTLAMSNPEGDLTNDVAEWQTMKVTLPSGDGTDQQTVEVPLIKADKETLKNMLNELDPILSDVAVRALEQTGHRVEQRRTYYPVELDDGREAVLPMDVVEVQYTGGWQ